MHYGAYYAALATFSQLLARLSVNRVRRLRFLDLDRLTHLRVLELRNNKLTSLEVQLPPTLQELYLVRAKLNANL